MSYLLSVKEGSPLRGGLKYLTSEQSLFYEVRDRAELEERAGMEGVTSLVVDTLQLELSVESGELLFAWGYFPMPSWESASLAIPSFSTGRIFAAPNVKFMEGVSVRASSSDWRIEYDSRAGLLNVRSGSAADLKFVQIAEGVVLGVGSGKLLSIWLKPMFC
ncbi:hypothetical protein ACOALZ_00515 [Nocardiopsis algeriensis]|uniref:hypothetical protein n=1 Tax=Nocardiopsis algeriensis TaxID=1478215 RepID=UPI003B42BE7F